MTPIRIVFTLLLLPLFAGCASMAGERLAGRLSNAMLEQSDPEIVRSGAPAYLLLIDSLIAESPEDTHLLLAGARLYGAYSAGMVDDPQRRRALSDRALAYARKALCGEEEALCAVLDAPYRDLVPEVERVDGDGLPLLYAYATALVGWIEARSDDWHAIAALPNVEAMLRRVVALDPGHERGRAQLYLAALLALRPASLGGRPQEARGHFESAVLHSGGRDLMAKVEYARRYARLVFDRDLHDRLLAEVIAADPTEPGLTLSNVLAQRRAQELLHDGYF